MQRLVPARSTVRYLFPVIAIFVLLAGGGFAALETDTVESYWEGVWWALSLTPQSASPTARLRRSWAKALSSLIMVLGYVLLALPTAAPRERAHAHAPTAS